MDWMAVNMFTVILATIFKDDPLDPARAKRYRDKILIPGSTRDELRILEVRNRFARNQAFFSAGKREC